MSSNDELIIKQKKNGLYQVRHAFVDDLAHSLAGIEPSEEVLLIRIVADDIKTLKEADEIAKKYAKEVEEDSLGSGIEYGTRKEI